MTPLLGWAIVLLFGGCRDDPRPEAAHSAALSPARQRANAAFLSELEDLGYFKHLNPEQHERRRRAFLEQGWNALFNGPPHRMNPADAEDLAKGGVGEFVTLIAPFLRAERVRLPVIRDDHSTNGYTVWAGEEPHVMYSREEMARDNIHDEPGLTWGLSVARSFKLVNSWLAGARSSERLYAVSGGNDVFGIFLTPELFQLIRKHPDASPEDSPYEPNEVYPGFGFPEWHDWTAAGDDPQR